MRETERVRVEEPNSRPESRAEYEPAVYEPSALWQRVYDTFFRHIQVDEGWADEVRRASQHAHIVYVGRSLSFLDFLGLDFLVKRHGLPLVRFTNDLEMSVIEPFGRGARRLRFERQLPEDQALEKTLLDGASALLFLRRPPGFHLGGDSPERQGEPMEVDLIRTLVALQRRTPRPIVLMPQTLVWTKRPPSKESSIVDVLFGPVEWPGRVRTLLQFLFNFRNAVHRGGESFDLRAFMAEHDELTDAQVADAVRYALLRRMERERTLVVGPAMKTSARLKEELVRSPRLRAHMQRAAEESNQPLRIVEAETRAELDRLAAAPDPNVLGLFSRACRFVWNTIYDGVVVDEEGIARVREAARRGPVVLVPSHKSHVDYLIISSVFYERGLAPPLIAAGDNLSFFPLGALFRSSGAFFIRRSFKGRKLYPHIVDAYIRKVLVEGHNIEVFLEGGRSRTGKLLPPKLGILSMIVDAGLKLRDTPVHFVPISIGYERIIEEGSYVHELEGGEKRPEDLGGLLRAPRVLRSRYGRLYLQFGELFDLGTLRDEACSRDEGDKTAEARELSPSQRRAVIQRIAHRITYEINRVTVVTPASLVATVLLAHRKRGMAHDDLVGTAEEIVRVFHRLGATTARSILGRDGRLRADTLEEAVRLFMDARLVSVGGERSETSDARIYSVPDTRRLALEYFKNNVVHFFVPSAMVASALAALGWETSMSELRERVRLLSRLYKFEFQYRADAEFEEIFSDALGHMIEANEVVWEDDRVRRANGPAARRLSLYADMLRTYGEAYLLTLRLVRDGRALPVPRKEWVKQALQRGRRAFAAGEIELRESISQPKLDSALHALHDLGLLRLEASDIKPGPKHGDGSIELWARVLEEQLRAM